MSVGQNSPVGGSLAGGYRKQKSWAVQISKLHSDGQITERRIHIYRFDDENALCCDLGECTVYRSSLKP